MKNTTETQVTKMMVNALIALASLAGGCATVTGTQAPTLATQRGVALVERGAPSRAVVEGPATIHAWSEIAGGSIFTAPAVTGTDQDCSIGASRSGLDVPGDHSFFFHVPAGEVACLANGNRASIELLWHATDHRAQANPQTLARR